MLFPEAFQNLPAPAGPELFEVDRLLKGSGLCAFPEEASTCGRWSVNPRFCS